MRIAFCDLFAQYVGLRMLTSQAENSSARNIGMMQIACDQAAKIPCVFARSSAPAFVREELHAIDILEESMRLRTSVVTRLLIGLDRVDSAFLIQTRKISDLLTINLWWRVAQSFVESFAQYVDIAVLAENERNDEPVIARAYLSISALVSKKGAVLQGRYVRRVPAVAARFFVEV